MKLFQIIALTLAFTFVNGYKMIKDGLMTGEAWLHYSRSGLLNEVLSKRTPERRVVSTQSIRNKKAKQLREVITELLKGKPESKFKRMPIRKQNKQNKRKGRLNRFKKFHN